MLLPCSAFVLLLCSACGEDGTRGIAPDAGRDGFVAQLDGGSDAGRLPDFGMDAGGLGDLGADAGEPRADAGDDAAIDGGPGDSGAGDGGAGDGGPIDGGAGDGGPIDGGPGACSLEGDWFRRTSSPQTFYMHFGADTTFYYSNAPSFPELRIIVRAMWSETDTRLTLGGADPGGTADECDTLTGVYDYVLSADCNTVTFTLVSDACEGRELGIAFTWTRGGSDIDPCLIPDGDADGHPRHTCGGDDCTDFDGATYPGATETCNGNDDDCDRLVDEGFDCAVGATVPCMTSCAEASTTTCSASCAVSCPLPTTLSYAPASLPSLCGTLMPSGERCVTAADNCYIAYGQYVRSLAAGDYVAHFSVSSPSGVGATLQIDVNDAVDGTGTVAAATRTVSTSGEVVLDLPFTAPGSCHRLEFRIQVISGDVCYRSIDVR